MSPDVRTAGSLARLQRGLAALCLLGGCMLAGARLLPRPAAHAAGPMPVRVAGELVDLSADPTERADRLIQRYLETPLALHAGDRSLIATRKRLGVKVDRDHLAALLAQAADSRSPLRRSHAQTDGARSLSLAMPIELDPKSTAAFAGRLKNAVDRAPIEPRVDPRKRLVFIAKEGVELDLDGTVKRIANALGSGARDVDAVLVHIPTRIAPSAWAKLDMRAVLGEFETRYQPVSVSADRTDPLKKLASKIDGYVLEPGALFDFNDVVLGGATDKSLQRPTADREWVDGACQIASTLHAALFFAGLPILLRYPQSRPSFYIKLGLDAAVGDTERDLRFQNDRSYPIVIGLRVDDGRVYASIHGPARDHSVQFIRHIDTVMPFEERIVRDASLPGGLRVLAQRGMPGFKITRYRIVTDEVSHVSVRERTRDIYPPTPQLWRIGTGREPPPDFERPRNDAHPEYVADEYLQMTQTEAGTFDVARDIGRTGSYGWIAREGMLVHKE